MLAGLTQLEGLGHQPPRDSAPGGTSAESAGICILFVLTDGVPSSGETNLRNIERNVKNQNQDECAVVTLGNMEFYKNLVYYSQW